MCVLPIHHVNGTIVTLVTPFYCKGSVVLNRKFKTATFWPLLHETTTLPHEDPARPSLWRRLLARTMLRA